MKGVLNVSSSPRSSRLLVSKDPGTAGSTSGCASKLRPPRTVPFFISPEAPLIALRCTPVAGRSAGMRLSALLLLALASSAWASSAPEVVLYGEALCPYTIGVRSWELLKGALHLRAQQDCRQSLT